MLRRSHDLVWSFSFFLYHWGQGENSSWVMCVFLVFGFRSLPFWECPTYRHFRAVGVDGPPGLWSSTSAAAGFWSCSSSPGSWASWSPDRPAGMQVSLPWPGLLLLPSASSQTFLLCWWLPHLEELQNPVIRVMNLSQLELFAHI